MDDFEKNLKIKSYYEESSYYEDHSPELSNLNSRFQKYRISKLMQIYTPKSDEKVVDIGCGWGTLCFALSPLCKEVVGVDFSQKSIDLCARLLSEKKHSNIKFVCSDAQNTPLKSEEYDVVVCADIFEHLYPDIYENVLVECRRLLKKGGKLVVWTPHRRHIIEVLRNNNIILKKMEGHVDFKSMGYLLESMRRNDFIIKKAYYAESHNPGLNILEKIFQAYLPLLQRRIAILAEKK